MKLKKLNLKKIKKLKLKKNLIWNLLEKNQKFEIWENIEKKWKKMEKNEKKWKKN